MIIKSFNLSNLNKMDCNLVLLYGENEGQKEEVIKLIEEQKLSQGHAKVLVGLENAAQLAKKIVDKKLSVRQAESLVRIYKSPRKFKLVTNNTNIKALERNLEEKTGLKAN